MSRFVCLLGLLTCALALPAPPQFDPMLMTRFMAPSDHQALAGPSLAPSWTAHATQRYPASTLAAQVGTYWRDAPRQSWRFHSVSSEPIFHPEDHIHQDQLGKNISAPIGYNLNMTIGTGADSVCKAFPQPYYDLFSALQYARETGSGVVAGEPCSIWKFHYESPTQNLSFSSCIASDGVPRQFNMTTGGAYKAASAQYWTFVNVSVGPVPASVFINSDACANRWPMPPCKATGTGVEVVDMYRVRSSQEPNVLANRDLGDALGDMAFFCALAGIDETSIVTHWRVRANSSWGQYSYCLYQSGKNVCYGTTGKLVGRESAIGMGKGAYQGQCSLNDVVGSWYSIPAEGECAEGAPIGSDGCTWSGKALRSVGAGCILNERGLKQSCAVERGHAPMLKSAAIFRAALASSDPAMGGCPDVEEEEEDQVYVLPLSE